MGEPAFLTNFPEIPDGSKKKRPAVKKKPGEKKPRIKKVDSFISPSFEESPGCLKFQLPIKTQSTANRYEHWAEKVRRIRMERNLIQQTISPHLTKIALPCRITMKRFGARLLDAWDNLPYSFKSITDTIAVILVGGSRGKGDADSRLTWAYDQQVSKAYGIELTFEF